MFTTLQLNSVLSFRNQRLLNFEVMAVRDKAKIAFAEKYTLIS